MEKRTTFLIESKEDLFLLIMRLNDQISSSRLSHPTVPNLILHNMS